jgi:UDP-N-acetylmuramate--alanine ligase
MKKIKNIHFIGIKGVGVTPLAIIAKEAGFKVTGCDLDEEFITDELLKKAGINALSGFDINHVLNVDLVITTGAHGGFDNPENIKAKELNIPILTQGQAVGEFLKGEIFKRDFESVSVSGTHGKTTTTAMIATILKENNFDPSFIIGTGFIPFLSSSGHYGKGKYFVAEADEYATEPKYDKTAKFLWQKPKIGVITNIEYDHPDVYPSIDDLQNAFLKFANGIEKQGALVVCIDQEEAKKLVNNYKNTFISYGFSKNADFNLDRVNVAEDKTFFWVYTKGTSLGEFSINVAGEHNALNALCAIVVCLELGLSVEKIKKGLSAFKGTKRRFEYIKTLSSGVMLFDDYAHHPTEIKKTLETFRKSFPNKKIVCIFQPHTSSRTKALFEQFISSFNDANTVILTDIYLSQREKPDDTVSSRLLSEAIRKIHKDVLYIENLKDVVKYVDQKEYGKEFVVVTMGAGDVK